MKVKFNWLKKILPNYKIFYFKETLLDLKKQRLLNQLNQIESYTSSNSLCHNSEAKTSNQETVNSDDLVGIKAFFLNQKDLSFKYL